LWAAAHKKINETLQQTNGNLQKDLKQKLKSFFYNETKRRPMIFVVVNEV
jgi:mRNA degradation ribonuclease J1/J2